MWFYFTIWIFNSVVVQSVDLIYQVWRMNNTIKIVNDIKTSFQILVIKWYMKSILTLIEYYLQQSSILSFLDLHQISKNGRNIYSFIHIDTNTSDWFGFDILEWIRKMNCLNIRNVYSIIQSFNIKLERVTKRGDRKLYPSEVIDVRLGRSIHQFIHINITFHYQWTRWITISSRKCIITKFDRIQIRKVYPQFIYTIQILDIIIDNGSSNT